MKLTKQQKIDASKVLAETLKAAPHLFFTEYQGMKFVELDELRTQLRPLKCRYAVVKNSLVRYALKNAGVDGIDPKMLKGPVGMIVAENDDPVAPAKVIATLGKKFPQLKVRAGYVSQKWMTPAD
jgi:large subunit ribosomal protein L10